MVLIEIKRHVELGRMDLFKVIASIEDELVAHALKLHPENKTQAATLLGINRTTLVEKMRRLGYTLKEPCRKKPTKGGDNG